MKAEEIRARLNEPHFEVRRINLGGRLRGGELQWKEWLTPVARKEVVADVVRRNKRSVVVRLADGNVIKRKLERDVAA